MEDKDFVISGEDVRALQFVVTMLREGKTFNTLQTSADKIEEILNNLVEL
jgi:fatty acid-binding protein DegV